MFAPTMVREAAVLLLKALALSKIAMAGVAGSERNNRSAPESRKIPPMPEVNPALGVIVRAGATLPPTVEAEL